MFKKKVDWRQFLSIVFVTFFVTSYFSTISATSMQEGEQWKNSLHNYYFFPFVGQFLNPAQSVLRSENYRC